MSDETYWMKEMWMPRPKYRLGGKKTKPANGLEPPPPEIQQAFEGLIKMNPKLRKKAVWSDTKRERKV